MTTIEKRSAVVKILPTSSDPHVKLTFLQDVESCLAGRRPRLVLDCSGLRDLSESSIHLMLHCLEEALKRNGDVKLAGLPISLEAKFQAAGLARLFDVHDTPAEAVAGFDRMPGKRRMPASVSDPTLLTMDVATQAV